MNFELSLHPEKYPKIILLLYLTVFTMASVLAEWEYQRLARIIHNNYRSKHSSRSLYSTRDLNRRAEKCAQYYVNLGSIDHTCPYVKSGGENIWAYWGGRYTDSKATLRSIDSWYAEERLYRYNRNTYRSQRGTGHFTQMVWRNTKALGFGVARRKNMMVAVGIYWPAGNYVGEYSKNVWRPYKSRNYGKG